MSAPNPGLSDADVIVAKLQEDAHFAGQEPKPAEHILQFFDFAHLPPRLQDVSRHFHFMAHEVIMQQPRNAERTVALRKLLESKDAAVRAALAK